jgi:hypothetical protein
VITGFNTDIEHDGVVYHVQTEDKGLDTPLILSLVYAGGAILASKRSRYEDLIESGFTDEALSERLSRQHRLICAAVHAGRIEDLKRMSAATAAELKRPATTEIQADPDILRGDEEREALEAEWIEQAEQDRLAREAEAARATLEPEDGLDVTQEIARPTRVEIPIPVSPFPVIEEIPSPVQDQRRTTVMGAIPGTDDGLRITILGRQEFRSGDTPTLKVMVGLRVGSQEQPIAKAAVSVKVLGTTFRPQIYSAKTQQDGVAVVTAQIPTFTSGRAAILIKAVASGKETELRRVILPG